MIPSIIGEARSLLDDAHHWARSAESTPVVTAKPGGVEREWDCLVEARKRLIAARNRIDEALAKIGGARNQARRGSPDPRADAVLRVRRAAHRRAGERARDPRARPRRAVSRSGGGAWVS